MPRRIAIGKNSPMSAAPELIPASSSDVGALLDDFIRFRQCRPRDARVLRRNEELPWIFRGYTHLSGANSAWRAWIRDGRIGFLVAERARAESRILGTDVLDVRFFDPDGLAFPDDLWERLPDGTWLQCGRSRVWRCDEFHPARS